MSCYEGHRVYPLVVACHDLHLVHHDQDYEGAKGHQHQDQNRQGGQYQEEAAAFAVLLGRLMAVPV